MSPTFQEHREWQAKARQSLTYKVAKAQSVFAYKLEGRMNNRRVSRSRLAGMISSSKAYVTKMLGGDANFTIETMVKVLDALDADLVINVKPRDMYLAQTWSNARKKPAFANPAEIQEGVMLSEKNRGVSHA